MQDADPELERLREAERTAHGLFRRMTETRAQLSDQLVLKTAEVLWKEAAAKLRDYEARKF